MIALTQFLEVLLAGVALVAMTVSVGGVAFVEEVGGVGARGGQRKDNESGGELITRK